MKLAAKSKKKKPKRPLKHVIKSVRQVTKIKSIDEHESIWKWGSPLKEFLPETFTIAIWNLWKGSGGDQFLAEYKRILENRHLVLCQEALLTVKMIGHMAPNGYMAVHGASYKRKDGLRDGVMTVSLVPPIAEPARILSLASEPILKTKKASLITFYKLEGSLEPLCVVNLHALLIRRPRTAGKEMGHILEKIAEHQGPVICAGDFNTFSKSYIREVDRILKSFHLIRAEIPDDPRTKIGSLDQLYVRGLDVEWIHVDTTFVFSDHFPILATLRCR